MKITEDFAVKLKEAMEHSYDELDGFRRTRKETIDEYVGHLYGNRRNTRRSDNEMDKRETILNKLKQMVQTYTQLLTSQNPRIKVATDHLELDPYAENLEIATNMLINKLDIKSEFAKTVVDAMFGLSIMKTGLSRVDDSQMDIDGHKVDLGQPFARRVRFDNFVYDITAEDWSEVDFIGDRYPRPVDYVNKTYKTNIEMNEEDDSYMQPERTAHDPDKSNQTRLRDYVYLWDIYLPKEQLLLTIRDGDTMPLKVRHYEGPKTGPYDFLIFQEAPDDLAPLPPAPDLLELHKWINAMSRKQGRQSSRSKTILAVETGAEEDAEKIKNAKDGDVIPVKDVSKAVELTTGGANPNNVPTLIKAQQDFDQMAGNLASLAGLGPQSETARQDMLLNESANGIIAVMQQQTTNFAQCVIKKLAWWMWTDPLIELPMIKRIPGVDVEIRTTFTADDTAGEFLDYNFEIVPYSMRAKTPQETANTLLMYLDRFALPTAQFAQQSGLQLNFPEISQMLAEAMDLPFKKIYTPLDPALAAQQSGPIGEMGKPAVTHRVNERISRSGTTPRGLDQNLMMTALGADPQNGQAAMMAGG